MNDTAARAFLRAQGRHFPGLSYRAGCFRLASGEEVDVWELRHRVSEFLNGWDGVAGVICSLRKLMRSAAR